MIPELLSPGGSPEAIRAAVNAGADAVYAGGRAFGARAYAQNPDEDQLREAIDYCHLHGAKLYLTVNTLLKEQEIQTMLYEAVGPAYECGVDAVLVQDFGVFRFLKREFPDLPLHASTQMTITGPDGVRLLEKMGAQRVVLSRELSLQEIGRIRDQSSVELETFVHGALCFCYSGQCLLSSVIGGRSGNRGRCAQPCRLPWDLLGEDQKALNPGRKRLLMSLKDLCTLELIPELVRAGIASLKIEGRMKSPEYAAGITSVYRKYLDRLSQTGEEGYRVDPEDVCLTEDLFHRGRACIGAYMGQTGAERVLLQERARQSAAQLRRTQEATERMRQHYVDAEPKLKIIGRAILKVGRPAEFFVQVKQEPNKGSEKACVKVLGAQVLPAQKSPLEQSSVQKQLRRSNETPFVFEELSIDLDPEAFLPVSALNALRRDALDQLRDQILLPYRRALFKCSAPAPLGAENRIPDPDKKQVKEHAGGQAKEQVKAQVNGQVKEQEQVFFHPRITCSVQTAQQLQAVLKREEIGGIYLEEGLQSLSLLKRVQAAGKKAYLMLPPVWRVRDMERYASCRALLSASDGVLLRSFDQLVFLERIGYDKERIADAGLYTWNREARSQLFELGITTDTLPLELSGKELAERGALGSEWIVFGRQSVMVTANCLTKTVCGCTKKPALLYMRDRTGAQFPVRNFCKSCTNIIYNSVPLDLTQAAREDSRLKPASLRWCFTVEDPDAVVRILEGRFADSVTRGAFRKGVE